MYSFLLVPLICCPHQDQLTHNVRGPHDEQFYKILAGLEDEYEALQRLGYSGEGFFSKGHRLGANVSHDLPPHLARSKALEAAEKRRRVSNVLGSGGRLGGSGAGRKGMTPRQLAAEVRNITVLSILLILTGLNHTGGRTKSP